MKTILSLLFVSFLCIGCGGARASTAAVAPATSTDAETIARLTAERDHANSELERYLTDPDASVGTSGGSAPVIATTMGSTTGGAIMSCDGVDSTGMVLTGMLTETMSFSSGDRPWETSGASTGGLRHRINYSGEFPLAVAVNGRVMHHFVGGMPTSSTMRMADGSNYCLMPTIPATISDRDSPHNWMSVDFIWDGMARNQTITFICLSGGTGRASTPFATFTRRIDMSATSGYTQVTSRDCRSHMGG